MRKSENGVEVGFVHVLLYIHFEIGLLNEQMNFVGPDLSLGLSVYGHNFAAYRPYY